MKIELLEEIDSTNKYIKRYLSLGEDVVVCARRQTEGMGTKGRSFLSREGGVYLTKLTYYRNKPASKAFEVMAHAAVSVCRVAQRFGVKAQIKWPNDVLVNGKKLCGILIENGIEQGMLKYSVVGIGLNVCNDLSELEGIAISLSEERGEFLSVEQVRDCLIEELNQSTSFSQYCAFVGFLGQTIRILEGEHSYCAVAKEIMADGRLKIEVDGEDKLLSAAEIRIRV